MPARAAELTSLESSTLTNAPRAWSPQDDTTLGDLGIVDSSDEVGCGGLGSLPLRESEPATKTVAVIAALHHKLLGDRCFD